jgi:hypothetical protein
MVGKRHSIFAPRNIRSDQAQASTGRSSEMKIENFKGGRKKMMERILIKERIAIDNEEHVVLANGKRISLMRGRNILYQRDA